MSNLLIHPSASQRRIVALEERVKAADKAIDTLRHHLASIVIQNGGSIVVPVTAPAPWELNASSTEDGLGILWTAKEIKDGTTDELPPRDEPPLPA